MDGRKVVNTTCLFIGGKRSISFDFGRTSWIEQGLWKGGNLMKRFSVCLLLVLSLFLTNSLAAAGSLEADNPVGKVCKDTIQLGGKTVPLPNGEWRVIAAGSDNEGFFHIYLLKEHGEQRFSYTYIKVGLPTQQRRHGYDLSKQLNRVDMLYVVEHVNIQEGAQDGWWINHFSPNFLSDKKSPIAIEAGKYIASNNYIVPNLMVLASHRLVGHKDKNKFLTVLYAYNLETEGFAQAQNSDWASSDWHVTKINQDPKKVEFIERLKTEHTALHEKIRAGFGDLFPFRR